MISVEETYSESTKVYSQMIVDFLITLHNKQGRLNEFYLTIFNTFTATDTAVYQFVDKIVHPLTDTQAVSPKVIQAVGLQADLVQYTMLKISQATSTNKTHLYYLAKGLIEHQDVDHILRSESLNASLCSILVSKTLSNSDISSLANIVANKLTNYFKTKDPHYRLFN